MKQSQWTELFTMYGSAIKDQERLWLMKLREDLLKLVERIEERLTRPDTAKEENGK